MEQKEIDKIVMQQVHGEVKAEDLPLEYIALDARIYCCNEECFTDVRKRCRLFDSYIGYSHVLGRKTMRGCLADCKGSKLPNGNITYNLASFGLSGKQEGSKPCKYFIEK